MTLSVELSNRTFNPVTSPGLRWYPRSYSHHAIGGPDQATIDVIGNVDDIWTLINYLRYQTVFRTTEGEAVWWGFINEIEITVGAMSLIVSLSEVANRVRISYSFKDGSTGFRRADTEWGEDVTSISTYGKKELKVQLNDGSTFTADNYRDEFLRMRKFPATLFRPSTGDGFSAVVRCLGWIYTLDWMYYQQNSGLEQFSGGKMVGISLSGRVQQRRLAQSFMNTGSMAWEAKLIEIPMRLAGDPKDDVALDICVNDAGKPGAVLVSVTLPRIDVAQSNGRVVFDFSDTPVVIIPNLVYWIVLRRTNNLQDRENHFSVAGSQHNSYPRGDLYITSQVSGDGWNIREDEPDLYFLVYGEAPTTDQMREVWRLCGQFFPNFTVDVASGMDGPCYRQGDATALAELRKLLDVGRKNGRRYICEVALDRTLHVYEEPPKSGLQWYYQPKGVLEHQALGRYPMWRGFAGQWVGIDGVPWYKIDQTIFTDPGTFFVERSEFDVKSLRLKLEPRVLRSPWDFGTMKLG